MFKNLSKLKDKDPRLKQNNLVYKIDCLYRTEERIYEDDYSIKMKNSEYTYHASHSTNLKHNFDFSNPKILDR